MARQAGIVVQNNFVQGLITEFTPLAFPHNAATEAWNVIFDYTGRVTRRQAFDAENNYSLFAVTSTDTDRYAFTEFIWDSAQGAGDIRFFVQQFGDTLYFYDISTQVDVSPARKSFTVDLSSYTPTDSNKNPAEFPCQYTTGNGDLIVVNAAINPIYIQYAVNTDALSVVEITMQVRDFDGVEDGLADAARPTESESTLKTNNPKHYYNLLNQGWHVGDALSQWDTARTDMPSNNDYIGTFRASDSDAFDNAFVTGKTGGNSPAPKGHFILEVGNFNRNTAMTDEGFTGATIDDSTVQVNQSDGTTIGDYDDMSVAFDDVIGTLSASVDATSGYIGKDLSSLDVKVNNATVYPPSSGWMDRVDFSNLTFQLYAKTGAAPTSSTDGTLLGTTTLTATTPALDINTGTALGDYASPENAVDGSQTTYAASSGSGGYIGRTADTDIPFQVTGATIKVADSNDPWVINIPTNRTLTWSLYGKTGSAPTSATDGTLLGSTAITATDTAVTQSDGTPNRGTTGTVAISDPTRCFDGVFSTVATAAFSSASLNSTSVGVDYSALGGVKATQCFCAVSGADFFNTAGAILRFTWFGVSGSTTTQLAQADVSGSLREITLTTTNTTYFDSFYVFVRNTTTNVAGTFRLGEMQITGNYLGYDNSNKVITSSDTSTFFDHAWIRTTYTGSGTYTWRLGEVELGLRKKELSTSSQSISSSDTTTDFDHVWVRTAHASPDSGNRTKISELYFNATYDATTSTGASGIDDITDERPSTCVFFAGRIWYSGLASGKLSSNIYFSQVAYNRNRYGNCYQQNDPTSEFFSILAADDGGVINIPEVGVVIKLFALKTAVLVFASNGIWSISGSNGRPFAANDFQVKKISGIGSSSPLSFIDYKGFPMWFGEDGIDTIFFDPQYETYEVRSLTDELIKSFYLDIPSNNRQYVKGTYSLSDDVVYWLYSSKTPAEFDNAARYKYDKVLCYSGRNNAFYPWTTDDSSGTSGALIRGLAYVFDNDNTDEPYIKFTTTYPKDEDEIYLTYADNSRDSYTDWSMLSSDVEGDDSQAKDYESYFITAYQPDGEAARYLQANYLMVATEPTISNLDDSILVQGIYDFASSGDSGKFSNFQQAYNSRILNRNLNIRKLRIRGHGRSIQLKFKSETGKPFTLVGWSMLETAQGNV